MRIAIGMGVGMQRRASAPAASGTITIDTLTYTRGAAGVAPTVATTVSSTGTTTGTYTLWGVLAATAQTKAQIDASPNKFSITAAALADLDGSIDLGNSATDGVLSVYITDSSGSPVVSAVATTTGVTYDSVAPAFASAEIGTVDATSLIVTFSKATYGSTSAADWDVQVNGSPATESAVAFTPGGTTADITLGAAVVNGDTVTVAYTGTGLVGVDAEVVATFTAQSVTNNVAAAASTFTTVAGGPYFVDPANVPANTTRIEFEARLSLVAYPAAGVTSRLFAQESTGCDLLITTNGGGTATTWGRSIEDGTGVIQSTGDTLVDLPALDTMFTVVYDADLSAGTVDIIVNGSTVFSDTFTAATPTFQTAREISFLGTSAGGNLMPIGTEVEYLRAYFTTSGVRTLRKEIAGDAAAVNADLWKFGSDAV